jgi:hypothetical protein
VVNMTDPFSRILKFLDRIFPYNTYKYSILKEYFSPQMDKVGSYDT